ncbi:MAG: copper resistance protein CopC [Thermoleophilia bacterium]|nr:copper resistance protein CopC/CopD [Gaiellaceae bacterium]MDW8339208.1 copper resistance protein CopC [Thermoleophilia bacterium]
MRTGALGLSIAALVALFVPTVASAHATLRGSSPATQSSVAAPPTEVRLRFDQAVSIGPRAILVLAADGAVLSGPARLEEDGRVVVAPVVGLARGQAYTVRWQVTSLDGHSPAGVFTFGVGVAAPPPMLAVGARGTTWRDDAARWGLFVALAFLVGPLSLRLLVLRGPVPSALERRIHLVTTGAALAAINIGIVAFVVRASNALQLPLRDLLYGDLQPFAEKTRFGIAFLVMTVGLGAVLGLLLLSWVFDALALRPVTLVLSLGLLSGLSLSGHQATEPNATWLSALVDWLHLVAASLWVGGVATLALLVWPAAPELRRRAFVGFSRLAVVLVLVLALGGVYLAIERLSRTSDLWTTGYGQLLLAKLAIVAGALAFGAFHHLVVRPRIEAGAGRRARSSLVGETLVALAVLLAAAVLTNASPPPPDGASAPRASSAG